ncbi:hypothetical protein ACJ5NV_15655 [Loktanella agnita]|uniref:hypothetical protein n=1 Tax=Loktanella agnita TaxID=287097 RepID=UPI00398A1383
MDFEKQPDLMLMDRRLTADQMCINWSTDMRLTTTLAAAALSVSGLAANAGGLSPQVMEAPVVVVEEPAPAGSSVNSTYIILGVLAALLIAAAVNADD